MKSPRISAMKDLHNELFADELVLISNAIVSRNSHLKSVDLLNNKDFRQKKQRTCPTPAKRRFNSKEDAMRFLHVVINRRNRAEAAGEQFQYQIRRVYKCGASHHFHVTSKLEHASLESFNVA